MKSKVQNPTEQSEDAKASEVKILSVNLDDLQRGSTSAPHGMQSPLQSGNGMLRVGIRAETNK